MLNLIQILNLYHTNISTFPECILQLKKLEVLDLRNTSISFIPNSIELLTNLQTLSLGGSSITALPVLPLPLKQSDNEPQQIYSQHLKRKTTKLQTKKISKIII